MTYKPEKKESRTPSLFEKLNKLTSINYPTLHDKNTSKLFELNDEKPPNQNIFKINYTVIQNEIPHKKTFKFNDNPHKKSLFSQMQRRITQKKRSFSENGRFSFSNIEENEGNSGVSMDKFNNFDTFKQHSNYFEEKLDEKNNETNIEKNNEKNHEKNDEKNNAQNNEKNMEEKNIEKNHEKKFVVFSNKSAEKIDFSSFSKENLESFYKLKTNSLDDKKAMKIQVFPKKTPNITIDLNILQDEYDFGMKKTKENQYRQSIFIDNQTENLKKIPENLENSQKNYQKNILIIKDPELYDKNDQNHEENENSSQKMLEISKISSISIINEPNLRKKQKLMTKVRFNDYQNQMNSGKTGDKLKNFCIKAKETLMKIIRFFNFKHLFEEIREQIHKGFIDVLITCK